MNKNIIEDIIFSPYDHVKFSDLPSILFINTNRCSVYIPHNVNSFYTLYLLDSHVVTK